MYLEYVFVQYESYMHKTYNWSEENIVYAEFKKWLKIEKLLHDCNFELRKLWNEKLIEIGKITRWLQVL